MSCLQIIAADGIDDTGGLFSHINLDSNANNRLDSALDLLDGHDFTHASDPHTDFDGAEKAEAVCADIDRMGKAANLDQVGQEVIDEAHGEIAVSDGAAEGAILGARGIHMDPLMITSNVCKAVDTGLIDQKPVGWAEASTLSTDQIARGQKDFRHARWLDTDTISPVI